MTNQCLNSIVIGVAVVGFVFIIQFDNNNNNIENKEDRERKREREERNKEWKVNVIIFRMRAFSFEFNCYYMAGIGMASEFGMVPPIAPLMGCCLRWARSRARARLISFILLRRCIFEYSTPFHRQCTGHQLPSRWECTCTTLQNADLLSFGKQWCINNRVKSIFLKVNLFPYWVWNAMKWNDGTIAGRNWEQQQPNGNWQSVLFIYLFQLYVIISSTIDIQQMHGRKVNVGSRCFFSSSVAVVEVNDSRYS